VSKTIKEDRTESAILAALAEHRGEKLTRKQTSDLKWWRKAQTQAAVEATLASLPKKLYCELSDRQVKVINEQAARYELPIGGPTVDMYDAVRAFHDFLADNADLLGDDDDLRKEKLRKEINVLERKARMLDYDIKKQKSQFIDRSELRRRLTWLAGRLKTLGETLGKVGGQDVQNAMNDFLEELAVELEKGHLSV
jgi:hypothetical protein